MFKINKIMLMVIFCFTLSSKIGLAQDSQISADVNIPAVQNYRTAAPSGISLSQNYQYPFTIITFRVIKQENVKLLIVNESGHEVITIFNKQFTPGSYQIKLDATDLGSEVYFCKILTPSFSETEKLMSN